MRFILLFIVIILLGSGCAGQPQEQGKTTTTPVLIVPNSHGRENLGQLPESEEATREQSSALIRVDFSEFNPVFRFSAELPSTWQAEYVPEIEALNIYGPVQAAMPARELSQIFIRYFEASDFLTLRTVDILERAQLEAQGHAAVRYTIRKKKGVADFPYQPSWRNETHEVTDVRFAKNSPGVFYVFGRNPDLPKEEFEKFFQSIQFHNDRVSFSAPIDRAAARVTKKPFGLKVAPENSPVQPERFSGYHTAVDFEVSDEEKDRDVEVRAFCGGTIREKRTADGYGGVVVQECVLGDQAVTVVYGHLKIDPSPPPSPTRGEGEKKGESPFQEGEKEGVGEYVAPGDIIGVLGAGGTSETDGERKHLHFGIHKGTRLDLRGYVKSKTELDQWLNPWQYIPTQ
ncbi:M23 family metallopeptidase [Candidatus Uhrbacteria bacterium]|nr:M23 family metallopeptidase [Candidatus Uhrbacteria bacterium]